MRERRLIFRGSLILLPAISANGLSAQPASGSTEVLSSAIIENKDDWAQDLAAWHQSHPITFKQLNNAILSLKGLDKKRTGPLPFVAPYFTELGPDMFWPIFEALTQPTSVMSSLDGRTRAAAKVGMLEAIGTIAPERGPVVYKIILKKVPQEPPPVIRAALIGLALARTAESEALLLEFFNNNERLQPKIAVPMSMGHQVKITQRLVDVVMNTPDGALFKQAVRALGVTASGWELNEKNLLADSEALAARDIAIEGLLALETVTTAEQTERLDIISRALSMVPREIVVSARNKRADSSTEQ